MSEDIDYTAPRYKDAALALAEATPRHLDQPTTPPIHWRLEVGADHDPPILRVLLADGRTVRGPLPVGVGHRPARPSPAPIMTLPIHKATAVPAALKPPAKHKAGK
jgi:hypothetical protein